MGNSVVENRAAGSRQALADFGYGPLCQYIFRFVRKRRQRDRKPGNGG